MNGRLALAGHDPTDVRFPLVLNVAWALLIDIYREYDKKFYEATSELTEQIVDQETPEGRRVRERTRTVDDSQSMVLLQAMMKDSDFRGPKG